MTQLVDMINYRSKRMRYTPEQLSLYMGINVSTFYNRKKKPEQFRLNELQEIAKRLKIEITIRNDGNVSAKGEL